MGIAGDFLRAHEREWAVSARHDPVLFSQIINALGLVPFHVIHPQSFAANLAGFQQVLACRKVSGRVFYGKKANKAGAWLREIAARDGSIDVASIPEFVHALAHGIRGTDICVTGAAKSDELLWLAARHKAVIAIDELSELERLLILAQKISPINILLRVLSPINEHSRFGFNPSHLRIALKICSEHRHLLSLNGFSFHLDGYAVEPRAALASSLIDHCIEMRKAGLRCNAISIGGGFACQYVEQADWLEFTQNISPDQFHANKCFSHFYPYHQAPVGAEMLDCILQTQTPQGTLAEKLNAAGVRLYLEPGRALLDGAGFSVFPVQGFKQIASHGIVTIAGLSMSLSEQWKNSEFLPSPLLVQRGPVRPQKPVWAAIGGSSCMEYDVLTWRKIRFPAKPRHGDLIIYPNTAGYQMDKNESEFHQLPLPPKIVVHKAENGFIWRLDQ